MLIFQTHIHIIPRKARDCLWTSEVITCPFDISCVCNHVDLKGKGRGNNCNIVNIQVHLQNEILKLLIIL